VISRGYQTVVFWSGSIGKQELNVLPRKKRTLKDIIGLVKAEGDCDRV